jgi:2-(1,2-epoxy-1,2-dihydrophenyl)acetyl-CoA isomerase
MAHGKPDCPPDSRYAAAMTGDPILLAHDGAIATLTLNRPDSLNSLDPAMLDALVAHTIALGSDDSVRCIVIRGAGRHFMAGGDIRTFATSLGAPPAQRQQAFAGIVQRVHAAVETIYRMPHPVIAAVHGAVAGFGLSLMCACDLAVAAHSSYFTSAYRHIGLTPDGGATFALPRIVGVKKAMEIVLLGERFGADEALRLGLINRVVPEAELGAVVEKLAAALASGPALALRNGKRLINQSLAASLSMQLDAEAKSFGACSATPDFVEGIGAFLDKRTPRFD